MRIHLDTDFGGDPDDACALAFLLGWPDVEIVGITTNLDQTGKRAGCVSHYLNLAGRSDVPVCAGAGVTLTDLKRHSSTADDARYWPEPIGAVASSPGAAADLLSKSIQQGATIVAIGAPTNLALLEIARPGSLADVSVVLMGGWVDPPKAGLPAWGADYDFNVQCDTRAALILSAAARLTLVTLPATLTAHLRAGHLQRLRRSGPIGELLARQSELHAADNHMGELGRDHSELPDDLLNFHYDPVACGVAVGWSGASIEEVSLKAELEEGIVRFRRSELGRPTRVVTAVDGQEFSEIWLETIEALGRSR